MLLGYITGVVTDEKQAENYLSKTFASAATDSFDLISSGENIYCKLQTLARKQMAPFFDTVKNCTAADMDSKTDPVFDKMTDMQKKIFCGLHYHGKSTKILAAEYNMDETDVRKIIKEVFAIIRHKQ